MKQFLLCEFCLLVTVVFLDLFVLAFTMYLFHQAVNWKL